MILDWGIGTAGERPATSNVGQPVGDFQRATYYEQIGVTLKASTSEGQARCARGWATFDEVGAVRHRMRRTGPAVQKISLAVDVIDCMN